MESHRLWVKHKHNWGQRFILLLSQAATLSGSDAASDVVEPASYFIVENHQTAYSISCAMHAVNTWSAVCSMAPDSQCGKEARPPLCMNKCNCPASLQTINFNSSYSEKVNFNRPGIGLGYESTKPGRILTVLCVPSMVCPLSAPG